MYLIVENQELKLVPLSYFTSTTSTTSSIIIVSTFIMCYALDIDYII